MEKERIKEKKEFIKKADNMPLLIADNMLNNGAIDFIATGTFFSYIFKHDSKYRALITSWGRKQREIYSDTIHNLKNSILQITEDW